MTGERRRSSIRKPSALLATADSTTPGTVGATDTAAVEVEATVKCTITVPREDSTEARTSEEVMVCVAVITTPASTTAVVATITGVGSSSEMVINSGTVVISSGTAGISSVTTVSGVEAGSSPGEGTEEAATRLL